MITISEEEWNEFQSLRVRVAELEEWRVNMEASLDKTLNSELIPAVRRLWLVVRQLQRLQNRRVRMAKAKIKKG